MPKTDKDDDDNKTVPIRIVWIYRNTNVETNNVLIQVLLQMKVTGQ